MNEQNKLAEQLKAKKEQQSVNKEQDKLIQESAQKTAVLEAQVKLLQEQLLLKKSDEEESKLQQEAERLKKEQAALEEEANLRKTLSQAFPPRVAKADEDEEASLKPDQMIGVMADAVGKAIDAQSKLLLSKVNEALKKTSSEQESKITGIQQALIKLVAGMSVDQAKSQHKDFDQFTPDIKEILSSTQGLSPEDAYLLAKAKRSMKSPSQREVETERPNEAAAPFAREELSQSEQEESDEPRSMSSKKIFKDAVDKAISKILAAKQK